MDEFQPDVPEELLAQAQQAVVWINQSQNQTFELTGVVDYEAALQAQSDASYELGLVMCDGEICTRKQVRIQRLATGFEFTAVETAPREIPPLLDPPIGIRADWLDMAIAKHEFVLLLFYRGLW